MQARDSKNHNRDVVRLHFPAKPFLPGRAFFYSHPHFRELHQLRVDNLNAAFDSANASPALADVPRKGLILT